MTNIKYKNKVSDELLTNMMHHLTSFNQVI